MDYQIKSLYSHLFNPEGCILFHFTAFLLVIWLNAGQHLLSISSPIHCVTCKFFAHYKQTIHHSNKQTLACVGFSEYTASLWRTQQKTHKRSGILVTIQLLVEVVMALLEEA